MLSRSYLLGLRSGSVIKKELYVSCVDRQLSPNSGEAEAEGGERFRARLGFIVRLSQKVKSPRTRS